MMSVCSLEYHVFLLENFLYILKLRKTPVNFEGKSKILYCVNKEKKDVEYILTYPNCLYISFHLGCEHGLGAMMPGFFI